MQNINNRYAAVRSQIGNLMAVLSFNYYVESISDSKTFIENCNKKEGLMLYDGRDKCKIVTIIPELFAQIENWKKNVNT